VEVEDLGEQAFGLVGVHPEIGPGQHDEPAGESDLVEPKRHARPAGDDRRQPIPTPADEQVDLFVDAVVGDLLILVEHEDRLVVQLLEPLDELADEELAAGGRVVGSRRERRIAEHPGQSAGDVRPESARIVVARVDVQPRDRSSFGPASEQRGLARTRRRLEQHERRARHGVVEPSLEAEPANERAQRTGWPELGLQ